MQDWTLRVIESYDVALQDWIEAAKAGRVNGPNAWDGHFAAVTAGAGLKSMHDGGVAEIRTPPRPGFYD
jgi:myo-inositol 2-dehydrogenase/D-chiro-inositol 1-dehydrogenase